MKSDRSHWADRTEYSRSCEKHLDKTALSRRSKSVLTYLTPLVHSPRQVPTRCRRRWRCRRVVAPRWAQMRPSDAQECSPSQPPPSRLSSPACLTTIVDIRLRPGQVLPPPVSPFIHAPLPNQVADTGTELISVIFEISEPEPLSFPTSQQRAILDI